MTTAACSARTPKRRSSGRGRETCRAPDCRRRGRTQSRTQALLQSRAVHRPYMGLRHRDRPKSDQVRDSVACRFGPLLWLVLVGEARLVWLARASGIARVDQARCQGAGRPVRQPANPVAGQISVAMTDSGAYWTLVQVAAMVGCRPMPGSSTPWWPSSRSTSGAGDLDAARDGGHVWLALFLWSAHRAPG